MKVKMTRTERALRKAQKAAKVAYKLGKAPTPYEFTNPVDLMTKEEKLQWELEKYFEDIKGTQYYDEVMSTCEWLLNDEETWVSESTTGCELAQWVFNEYYRGAACKKVSDIPEYKERIKYTTEVAQMMGLDSLAENAKSFLETASGTILGHFWLYETVNGGYVIDSVEARQSLDVEKLTTLVKSWVSLVRPNHKLYISDCSYGITQKVIATLRKGFSLLAEEEPAPAFNPEGHYEYRDSRYGVFSIN